jgi:DNA-directed RNA polymerase subunit RPC12/RpoP
MGKSRVVPLKIIAAPAVGPVVSAPPVLKASDHTVDYTCGNCGTLLMHAEEDQVHNLHIHCLVCGSYNSTDE